MRPTRGLLLCHLTLSISVLHIRQNFFRSKFHDLLLKLFILHICFLEQSKVIEEVMCTYNCMVKGYLKLRFACAIKYQLLHVFIKLLDLLLYVYIVSEICYDGIQDGAYNNHLPSY